MRHPHQPSGVVLLFVLLTPWTPPAFAGAPGDDAPALRREAGRLAEWTFESSRDREDPFHAVQIDALFTGPDGGTRRVPAFWAGGRRWKVRYSSGAIGLHSFRTECSDPADGGLHGRTGRLEVAPYAGDNALYRHGPIRVAPDRRHFEHADGTPFFWLGDTWWMGLSRRLEWPSEFQALARDRREKGFSAIQIVAGLYPDMGAFDERGANEAGFPWETDYRRIRPEYFDAADPRILHLVETGLVPCIVGAWGYHLPWLGPERMQLHLRHVMARWGALPVVWCAAGEFNLPYYLEPGFPRGGEKQARQWEGLIPSLRAMNAFERLVTIHPTGIPPLSGRLVLRDASLLDFDMLQTGHGRRDVLRPTVEALRASLAARPAMPVINAEVAYEALNGSIPAEIPRLVFWVSMLSGAAGHTYGANGIWQLNRKGRPYGPSPHGGDYGPIPWDEAMHLPGSRQIGLGKKLLEEYPWQRFEPHPEWAAAAGDAPISLEGCAWIWFPESEPSRDAPAGKRCFRRSFTIAEGKPVARARLVVSADDRFTAYLNGEKVGSGSDWRAAKVIAGLEGKLRPGGNLLAIAAENGEGPAGANPAGLISRLEVESEGRLAIAVTTGPGWRAAKEAPSGWEKPGFDDSAWVEAALAGRFGDGPWGRIGGAGEFERPHAAGIAGEVRVIYSPDPEPVAARGLEAGKRYRAMSFHPETGEKRPLGEARPDDAGAWTGAVPTGIERDWVLILDAREQPGNR